MALSRAQAKRLVEKIAKDHGHLGEEVYAEMSADARRKVEEALLKKDEIIGSSIITLAKNLYSKDVRFIFELLQNADDNHFLEATGAGNVPFVSFRIYNNRIIIDCNEDGFTEGNLRAICNVGKSSKTGTQGYIGEKGIGFKSVFKVAWKVHIQSGPFSFGFKHRPGDSGMGMISPEWQEPAGDVPGSLTRMTFMLHDDGGTIQCGQIAQEFRRLQHEMLLFLKRLKRIEVRFFDDNEAETSAFRMSMSRGDSPHRFILEKVRRENGEEVERARKSYHVTKEMARGLAMSENREYSDQEREAAAYLMAEVVLAFPLDDQSVPVVEPQDVFAFLPIRRSGFSFLIHSDFVTMANREDIVTSSLRNRRLRKFIVSAFISAVKQMCEHPTLRFQWMRYLPPLAGYPWDEFWKGLVDMLRDEIQTAEVLAARGFSFCSRRVRDLRRLTRDALDQHGNPLFDDFPGTDAVYVSQHYSAFDLNRLKEYGLEDLSLEQFISRVERDLGRPDSKMKSRATNSDWHSRAAQLLHRCIQNAHLSSKVSGLGIIPLSNGSWVNGTSGLQIFFQETADGVSIPSELNLQLVDADAAGNPDRCRLFVSLGATAPPSTTIWKMTLSRYTPRYLPPHHRLPNLSSSVKFLRFLFLTEPENTGESAYNNIILYNAASTPRKPREEDFFFPGSRVPYSPGDLELDVNFVHPDYLSQPPVPAARINGAVGMAWREWLYQHIGVRKNLRIVSRQGGSFSNEFLFVAQHRPVKFLGLLKDLWSHEGSMITSSAPLHMELRKMKVLCEGGTKIPLSETFLPTPQLRDQRSRYLEEREMIPFLELESTLSKEGVRSWTFLSEFGVTWSRKARFLLAILQAIMNGEGEPVPRVSRLPELYTVIQIKCANFPVNVALVRDFFAENSGIYVPAMEGSAENWCVANECLLYAPTNLRSRYPIDSIYSERFPSNNNLATIREFFENTLGVPRCVPLDIVEELRLLKSEGCTDFQRIKELYKFLSRLPTENTAQQQLKSMFREEALVFVSTTERPLWYRTSDCLWSMATRIRGKVDLESYYGGALETFFVEQLGVRKLNIDMIFDELRSLTPQETTPEAVKTLLSTFNSLLQSGARPENRSAGQLLERQILPLRYPDGQVQLCASGPRFVIADRKVLQEKFRDRVEMLDFNLTQVRDFQPFLAWAGLEDRYLSRMVREVPVLVSDDKFGISDRRYDIKRKSHGLLRIAVHFRSPRVAENEQAFYDLLRGCETWETDGISSQLILDVDGRSITVQLERSDVYIDDDPSTPLKIFIPHDERAQDVCMQQSLPQKLMEWIMADPSSGEISTLLDKSTMGIILGLLNAKWAESIAAILDKAGVNDLTDIPNGDLEDDLEVRGVPSAPEPVTPVRPAGSARRWGSTPGTPEAVLGLRTPETGYYSTPGTDFAFLASPEPENSGTPSRVCVPLAAAREYFPPPDHAGGDAEARDAEYLELLNHVIAAARMIRFPRRGDDISPLERELFPNRNFVRSRFSASQFERDIKVGAAGELFVFELLSALDPGLVGFSRVDWTSNIKGHVKMHPDYASMTRWGGGVETSDLQYEDLSGIFTNLLIEKGYLASERWQGRTPKYFIEVKTTSSS